MSRDPLSLWLQAFGGGASPLPGLWGSALQPPDEAAMLGFWTQQAQLIRQLARAGGTAQADELAEMTIELFLSPLHRRHAWLRHCAPLSQSAIDRLDAAQQRWGQLLHTCLSEVFIGADGDFAGELPWWQQACALAAERWRQSLSGGALREAALTLSQALLDCARHPVAAGDRAPPCWLPILDGEEPALVIGPPEWPAPAVAEAVPPAIDTERGLVVFDWGDLGDPDNGRAAWCEALADAGEWAGAAVHDLSGCRLAGAAGLRADDAASLPGAWLTDIVAMDASGRLDPLWLATVSDLWSPPRWTDGAGHWTQRRERLSALPAVEASVLLALREL